MSSWSWSDDVLSEAKINIIAIKNGSKINKLIKIEYSDHLTS